jgi:Holliday junction resolvase RusA-like endonuclease
MKYEIKMKLPSANEYIGWCRSNRYLAASKKAQIETLIAGHIKYMPRYKKPVKIHFTWVEENKRRDLDNICFAKKFILDALVKEGKLADDNRRNVYAFTDSFEYSNEAKVILEVIENE